MQVYDYLVIGSGCSGAMAAQTLVEAGVKVTMLDAGIMPKADTPVIPDKDFIELRTSDPKQYEYLIGKHAEGVTWGKVGKGEQITPPRKHIMEKVDNLLPLQSETFSPLESLGYGGLGIGWGLQCWEFSPYDLKKAGLNTDAMGDAYETVASRIGISATDDDASLYTLGTLKHYQASPTMDRNHTYITRKYQQRKEKLNEQGFVMGRTPLGLITEDKDGRKGYAYHDMDFYSDNDQSAWRPWMTVNQLRKQKNFTYIGGFLITSFKEEKDYTEVYCLKIDDNTPQTFRCRKLVLATGALSSARVVLRSMGKKGAKLPLLCNPYRYIPCVQPKLVGKAVEPAKLGFTQLSLFLDEQHSNQDVSVASVYSYQSLMLFRIMRHVPLAYAESRRLMQYLQSGMVIMGVHHPDYPSSQKYLELVEDNTSPTGDALRAHYALTKDDEKEFRRREKKYLAAMRQMGTYGLKRVDPGFGASIHYAGTLPFSKTEKPLTLSPKGRLHGTKSVYVADSSGFNYLPAKGLTFSLMANAHLTALEVLRGK